MKRNKKKVIQTLGLLLLIMGAGAFNNAWAMEPEKPIYEILAQEKAAEKVAQQRINLHVYRPAKLIDQEELYSELVLEYKGYEDKLNKIRNNSEEVPLKERTLFHDFTLLHGGINYTMTLDEMKQKIQATFNDMKKNGLIFSKDSFEVIKDKYYHYDKDRKQNHHDLSRIGGIEYLKKKINENPELSKKWGVPEYIIVLDDPNTVSVEVTSSGISPEVKKLNNGKLYLKKIEGKRVARFDLKNISAPRSDIDISSGIGYDDFSDAGNIIQQTSTNKYYIVDTESRNIWISKLMDDSLKKLLSYAAAKFHYLNPGSNIRTYKFNLP